MRIFGRNVHLPWEPTSDLHETDSTALTPMGTTISRAFTVESGAQNEAIRHTLAVIDRLHGDGTIPPLIAKHEVLDGLNGQFVPGLGILIHPGSRIPEFTTAHELAHVLDFYGFTSGSKESLNGHEMMPIFDAWLASTACRRLQTLRNQL